MRLNELAIGANALVVGLDESLLSEPAIRRLRAIGINEGVAVETLHQGVFLAHDPIAVRVGRTTLAIRAAQAAAIEIEPA